MSFKYTPFSFLRFFGTGMTFPAFILAFLPLVIQQDGCSPKRIECASLVEPATPDTEIPVNSSFVWTPVEGDDVMYRVVIQDTIAKKILFEQNVKTTRANLSNPLPHGTIISVAIITLKEGKSAKGCKIHYFKTEALKIPECVELTSPMDGATGVSLEPVLRWRRAKTATSYIINIGTAAGNWSFSKDVGNVDNYNSWLDNSYESGQEIFVQVIPKNEAGTATGCKIYSFTTMEEQAPPAAPNCVNLKLTIPSATSNVSLDTDISWEGASGLIHGYGIKIGTSIGAEDIMNFTLMSAASNPTIEPSKSLPADTKIFVSITPFNTANGRQEATGCTTFEFTTEKEPELPSGCPEVTSPSNGATGVSLSSMITWKPATNASSYRLQAGLENDSFNLFDKNVGNVTEHKAYFLFYSKEIFLRVTPLNAGGNPINCGVQTIRFTTGPPPSGAPKYVRRDAGEMPSNHPHLETYKEGIDSLRKRGHWNGIASVHRQGVCEHGNWNFLPWHRAYLHHLEKAIRDITGDDDFALPYWNWTKYPNIPEAFLDKIIIRYGMREIQIILIILNG